MNRSPRPVHALSPEVPRPTALPLLPAPTTGERPATPVPRRRAIDLGAIRAVGDRIGPGATSSCAGIRPVIQDYVDILRDVTGDAAHIKVLQDLARRRAVEAEQRVLRDVLDDETLDQGRSRPRL